jgi:peptide/nickel transport system substrate-binding protein
VIEQRDSSEELALTHRTSEPEKGSRISRRDLVRGTIGIAVLAGTGGAISACGSSSTSASTAAQASAFRRGGTLRIGCTGGSSSDSVNPLQVATNADIVRAPLLFESLVTLDQNAQPQLQLAAEITPNKDATVWTIRVRKGILFHNGQPLTASDVLYTFNLIEKNHYSIASALVLLDLKAATIVDPETLRIPCHSPYSTFMEEMAGIVSSPIVPSGFNPKLPVGTGPFRFHSFTPGVQSLFLRNSHYWQGSYPYLDAVSVVEFADDSAQINALQSGQLDALAFVEANSLSELESGGFNTITSPGGYWYPFTMRVDKAPFTDVNVRQAFRLLVDRPQMQEIVFAGHGALANDLPAIWDADYASTFPQRQQDLEQAKSLLKKSGADNLKITLVTSNIGAGVVSLATVFAQQAQGAGVTVNVSNVPPTTFFGPDYLQRVFSQDIWNYLPYWPQVSASTLPYSPFNETHWNDPQYTALYNQGLRTVDPGQRKEIALELQTIQYNQGGYILPVFVPNLSANATHVHGLISSKTGQPFGGSAFNQVWLS